MPADAQDAVTMAGAAGAIGGVARVLIALHGGARGWGTLALEAGLGAVCGIIAAGFAVWLLPDLRDVGWAILEVSAFAGLAGALGTRGLDMVTAAIQRRLGGD